MKVLPLVIVLAAASLAGLAAQDDGASGLVAAIESAFPCP